MGVQRVSGVLLSFARRSEKIAEAGNDICNTELNLSDVLTGYFSTELENSAVREMRLA